MKLLAKQNYSTTIIIALSVAALVASAAFGEDKEGTAKPDATAQAAPAAASGAKAESAKPSPSEPLAKVNGSVITRGEVTRAVKVLLARNQRDDNLPPELMKKAEESTLENLIAAELLYQAGQKLEIKEMEKLVEQKYAEGKARFGENFDKALKAADMTEKDLTEYTRKDIIINNLIEKEITPKAAVSDDDAKKFYNENQDRFKQEESVKASHILVGVDPKATDEEKKKARGKAEALLKRIKTGEDFAAIAKSDSTCPSSAQGGDLGFFGKGQMVAPFEKAAFAMKPGDISDVVETQFGYHIIKLTDKKAGSTISFEESRDKIKEFLKGQKLQKAVSDYIAVLKEKAKIEKMLQ